MSRPALAAALPILGALPLLAVPVLAKSSRKIHGVQAWTSGSQTYLRARPSQETPIIAKVVRHTPLFVWGKYNGWYRVETQDHLFGWVHYELVNGSGLGKVKELSHLDAQRASDRNGSQTMWGTPQQLTAYFQKYGAPGAVAGLREMGVKVSFDSKKSVRKVAAKPRPRPKAVAVKTTPRPKAVAHKVVAPKPSAPRVIRAAAPRVITPPRAAHHAAPKPVVRIVAPPVVKAPVVAAKAPVTLLPVPPRRVVVAAPKPKASARKTATQRKRDQLRSKMGTTSSAPPISAIAPVSPEELMKARRAYLDARKKKFGESEEKDPATTNDAMGGPSLTPSSFSAPNNALDPNGWAPFNANGWSATRTGQATFADWNSNSAPGFRLVIEEPNFEPDAEMDNGELKDWIKLPALESLGIKTVGNAKKKPTAAPSRGGSPRDRYKNQKGDFRQGMASQALTYRGRPYVFGAASPSRGFDCSGLIYFLLRQRGYNPPRTASGYSNYGTAVARGQWKPGDLILFANTYKRGISHIGIYLGNNNFVHAASTRQGVRVDSLGAKYYASKYYGARRVPGK